MQCTREKMPSHTREKFVWLCLSIELRERFVCDNGNTYDLIWSYALTVRPFVPTVAYTLRASVFGARILYLGGGTRAARRQRPERADTHTHTHMLWDGSETMRIAIVAGTHSRSLVCCAAGKQQHIRYTHTHTACGRRTRLSTMHARFVRIGVWHLLYRRSIYKSHRIACIHIILFICNMQWCCWHDTTRRAQWSYTMRMRVIQLDIRTENKLFACSMQHAADTADTEEKRRMYYNMILCFTFSFASTNSDMGIFFLRCAASALWWWWWCKCAERVSSVLYLQYWLVTTFIARNQHEFYCVLICCNMNILDVGYCLWTHLCWLDAKETM